MKRRRGLYILAMLPVVTGALLLSYPPFVDGLYRQNQTRLVDAYENQLAEMHPTEMERALAAAQDYNARLSGALAADSGAPLGELYPHMLDLGGIMGSVEIPKIGIHCCIYHGTGSEALQRGVGHLESTHLPIGGEGNHSVLTAHSGATAKLFTDLEQMEAGDLFYLHVLEETLAYRVVDIQVVAPSETTALLPQPGQDLVTLVTCTPYAINSHRLLVRGTRVPYTKNTYLEQSGQGAQAQGTPWQYIVSSTVLGLCGVVWALGLLRRLKSKRAVRQQRTNQR